MTRHIVVPTATGWAVARTNGDGPALGLCECATEESAAREARRLDREQQLAVQRAAVRGMVRAELGNRRQARWFEPDAFA